MSLCTNGTDLFLGNEDTGYDDFVRSEAGYNVDGGRPEFGMIRLLRSEGSFKTLDDGQIRQLRLDPYYNRMNRGKLGGIVRIL